jgi:NADPH:quinone reductase-like Zn-dependent oxidoreductase
MFVRLKLPFIPGLDIAGIVAEVGSAVTGFRAGDAVYAMLPNTTMGGYAEYAAVAESNVAHLPSNLTFTEAAAIPCAALTALQALRDEAQVKPETRVLIYGASGGVGSFAVQIAKTLGAHVTALCGGRNVEFVGSLGADEVIDYTQTDIMAEKKRHDVVFDAVGVYPFGKWKRILHPRGTLVTVNPILGNPIQKLLARFDTDRRQLKSLLVQPSGTDLEILNDWIASGKLRPIIDQCYPLAKAAEAHRYSETKRVRGKLVLIVDQQQANHRRQPQLQLHT